MKNLKLAAIAGAAFALSTPAAAKPVQVNGIAIKFLGHTAITENALKKFTYARYSSPEQMIKFFLSANKNYSSYLNLEKAWYELHREKAIVERAKFAALLYEAKEISRHRGTSKHSMSVSSDDVRKAIAKLEPVCERYKPGYPFHAVTSRAKEKARALQKAGFPHASSHSLSDILSKYCNVIYNATLEKFRIQRAYAFVVQNSKYDPLHTEWKKRGSLFSQAWSLGTAPTVQALADFHIKHPAASVYIKPEIHSLSTMSPADFAQITSKEQLKKDIDMVVTEVFAQNNYDSMVQMNLDAITELLQKDDDEFTQERKAAYKDFLIKNNSVSTYQWKLYQIAYTARKENVNIEKVFDNIQSKARQALLRIQGEININSTQTIESAMYLGILPLMAEVKKQEEKAVVDLLRWSMNLKLHSVLSKTKAKITFYSKNNHEIHSKIKDKLALSAIESAKEEAFRKHRRQITFN